MRIPALAVLWALLLTLAIECAAILIIFRKKEYAYYCVLCNLLTNPALNLLLYLTVIVFGRKFYYPVLIPAEVAVVFVEAVVYDYICRLGIVKAVMLSTLLNALSFAAGLLLTNVLFT